MSASDGAEQKEIERLEQEEADAMLGADVSTLQKLWADDLIVNSTANLIAGKQILLEMIRNGLLKLSTYELRL
jgi:ketosteroid isomerase-like protein